MAEPNYVSPSQVVYYRFPNAFFNQPNAVVQIRYITNKAGELGNPRINQYVREQIARRMTLDLQVKTSHHNKIKTRRASQKGQMKSDDGQSNDILDDVFGAVSFNFEELETSDSEMSSVRPQDIEFILIDTNARVRTRIFPRTFYCRTCGHFMALDTQKPPSSLACPCCKRGTLRQEPIIFGCRRCGNIQELAPKGAILNEGKRTRKTRRVEEFLGKAPSCPDCGEGHIHLEKHSTNLIQKWQWICTKCDYNENLEAQCLECAVPGTDEETSSVISMSAFSATATGAFTPLIDVQMFVGDRPLDPDTLYHAANQNAANWPDYFELKGRSDSVLISRLQESCIQNVYLLKSMSVVTSVYGYRAGKVMSNQRTPVDDGDQLANFFRDPEKIAEYLCFGIVNDGAALVIEFDRDEIWRRLSSLSNFFDQNYAQAVRREREFISKLGVLDLVQPDANHNVILFPALHAIEHAMLTTANRLIGSDSLGSILFLEKGILVLYERDEIGRGGVVQLVNRGVGLNDLIEAATDHVNGCAQGCYDSCPSCTYVRDIYCHYRYEDLGLNWLPPNALLSRNGARIVLSSED